MPRASRGDQGGRGWRRGWLVLAIAWTLAGTAAAADQGGTTGRTRYLMGARLAIEARGAGAADAIDRAFAEVERLERVLSNWRSDSEVSRVNRAASLYPIEVSGDLLAATLAALKWAERTGGAFDPTVEPLVRRYGLRGPEGRLPGVDPPVAIPDSGASAVGWRGIHIDPQRRTIAFADPGMGLDFGGIGKGIALDAAAATLRAAGTEAALLDFSGQVLVLGSGPDRGGWRVGVSDPADRERAALEVLMDRGSLSTSSNGERPAVNGTEVVGHILDPRNARPTKWTGSATVRTADATAADALSTALFVLGPGPGLDWAGSRGVDALYLWRDTQGRLERRSVGALFEPQGRKIP